MRILAAIAVAFALTTSVASAQTSATPGLSSKPGLVLSKAMTYSQAFKKAKTGDKPLLVLVTADWCPPCRQMKATTLPALVQRDAFKKFHFAMIDYDKNSKLADKLIEDRGLPQLIMFEKSNGKWLRRWINGNKGIHSVQSVESFMARAGTVRLAENKEENSNKK